MQCFSNVCGEPFGVLVKQQNESRIISYMLMMAFFLSYRCDICPRDSRLTGSLLLSAHALLARWELLRCWVNNRMNGNIKARPSWYIGPALRKKSALWYSPSPFLYRKKIRRCNKKLHLSAMFFIELWCFEKNEKNVPTISHYCLKRKWILVCLLNVWWQGDFLRKTETYFLVLKKLKNVLNSPSPRRKETLHVRKTEQLLGNNFFAEKSTLLSNIPAPLKKDQRHLKMRAFCKRR